MATINNSDLTKELVQGAKIQTSFDLVPSQLAEKVVPVMECNPKLLKVNKCIHVTTSGTMFTSSTSKDTYITGFVISGTNNTASSTGTAYISVVLEDGSTMRLAQINLTTTALVDGMSTNEALYFNFPVKIARNSAVALGQSGLASKTATIYYYEDDVSSA